MVTGKRTGNLAAEIQIREHKMLSGVLAKIGGADEGPNPHELLEAALAACTLITVQMYADRKQWNLRSADVSVKIESEKSDGAKIVREISLIGELDAEQRQRLLEIADRCPLHLMLTRPIAIETKLQPT